MKQLSILRHIFDTGLIVALVLFDQLTKSAVASKIAIASSYEILPWLDITPVWNTGVAFGMWSDSSGSTQTYILLLVIMTNLFVLSTMYKQQKINQATYRCLILMLAGGLSNLLDRVLFGAVFDFISMHYYSWYWPAYNFADLWVCLGSAGFIIQQLSSQNDRVEMKSISI